ncbi:unnamed protein product, partial [Pleuronectes platessa]
VSSHRGQDGVELQPPAARPVLLERLVAATESEIDWGVGCPTFCFLPPLLYGRVRHKGVAVHCQHRLNSSKYRWSESQLVDRGTIPQQSKQSGAGFFKEGDVPAGGWWVGGATLEALSLKSLQSGSAASEGFVREQEEFAGDLGFTWEPVEKEVLQGRSWMKSVASLNSQSRRFTRSIK